MRKEAILASIAYILPKKKELTAELYACAFVESKEIQDIFLERGVSMEEQQEKLIVSLYAIARGVYVDNPVIVQYLERLGDRHTHEYGVQPYHYVTIKTCLIRMFKKYMQPAWTPELEQDWNEAFDLIQSVMLSAH